MAIAEKMPTSRNGQLVIPPEERFWKRYSPHFELPLASMTSVFLHGLVIGVLAVGGVAYLFSGGVDALRPPQMDVALVDSSAGFGGDPGGAPAGAPGAPGDSDKQDDMYPGPQDPSARPQTGTDSGTDGAPDLPPVPGLTLAVPATETASDSQQNIRDDLTNLIKDASARGQDVPKTKTPKRGGAKRVGTGLGNRKGVGGAGGPGGMGTGPRPGPGIGGNGGGGPKASEAEIKAWRWEFDLKGNPKEHADKLDKAGLILAIPDPRARALDPKTAPLLYITDLKRRPAVPQKGGFNAGPDTVKWFNREPSSIAGLAQELRLARVPAYFVLLLPKDREARMAIEEQRYAQQNGNDVGRVQKTLFDFRLQNGAYEPMVLWQR